MLEITIDTKELKKLSAGIEGQIKKAMTSALKSESYRLQGELKRFAQTIDTPVSPLTMALRKGKQGIGPFLSRFMAYQVDPDGMSSTVGIIEGGPRAVRRSLAILARRQGKGYKIPITRTAQRRLAMKLQTKHKKLTRLGAWGYVGGLRSFIPKLGVHTSAARPIVDVVWAREKARSIENIKRNFAIKMEGGRY